MLWKMLLYLILLIKYMKINFYDLISFWFIDQVISFFYRPPTINQQRSFKSTKGLSFPSCFQRLSAMILPPVRPSLHTSNGRASILGPYHWGRRTFRMLSRSSSTVSWSSGSHTCSSTGTTSCSTSTGSCSTTDSESWFRYIHKCTFFTDVQVTIKITFCSQSKRIILTCSVIKKFGTLLAFKSFLINRCFLILKVEYIILKKFLRFCNILTCTFIRFLIACIYRYVNIVKRLIKPIIIKHDFTLVFKT